MNVNILLVGDCNSIYIYDYVRAVLLDDVYKAGNQYYCFHDSLEELKPQYKEYYKNNGIKVYTVKNKKWIYRFAKINSIIRKRVLKKILNSIEKIDNVHIHFVKLDYFSLLKKYRSKIKNIVITFWGSDLLRLPVRKYASLQRILCITDVIVAEPANMRNKIIEVFGTQFNSKYAYAIFGTAILDEIKFLKTNISSRQAKEYCNLPKDKIIITCGYNGKEAQQHDLILDAIDRCDRSLKKKLYLLFPVGYGYNDNYFSKIEKKLLDMNVDYKIDKKFYDKYEVSKLRLASDIFIHAQETDGFSSSVIEYIYADNILINASWINYPILDENNVYYMKFDSIDDLTRQLTNAVKMFADIQKKVSVSNGVLYEIRAWESVKKDWQKLYTN